MSGGPSAPGAGPGTLFALRPDERREIKKQGVALATAGLFIVLLVGIVLKRLGLTRITDGEFLFVAALTLGLQAAVWLVPHLRWDERLPWDRHYVYVPMGAVVILFGVLIYFGPETRLLMLMAWFVSLLFLAGLAGFRPVTLLSTAMTLAYVGAVAARAARGFPFNPKLEATVAAAFLIACTFEAVVFERLRRDRREMEALRRELAEQALTDSLTGLPNRRHFEQILRVEMARARRHGGCCSVVMIDLDHFKNYNDLLGHPAGDAVLRELGAVVRSQLRAEDVASRYGGEEFAVIMSDTTKSEGREVIERLRAVVEEHPFHGRNVQPTGRLTISAGIATFPEDGRDDETIVRRADAALYVAKSAGRNRVHPAA